MSLSESQRELLLSASLDGALSPEEQSLLEQWFREDPSALRQRDELAAMTGQLRAALAPAREAKLDQGFADRVVDAAIMQAQRENLPATHPLVRLANSTEREDIAAPVGGPTTRRPSAGSRMRWRWAATSVALAASILLVIYLGRPENNRQSDGARGLAYVDHAAQEPDSGGGSNLAAVDDATASGEPDTESVEIAAMDADAAASEVPTLDTRSRESGDGSTVDRIAASEAPRVDPPLPTDVAEAQPAGPPERGGLGSQPQALPLAAVLVVSVEMTPAGRDSLALLQALREADIQIGPAGVVSEQVVTHLRQSEIIQTPENDSAAKLYYIEAPAKQLDRFLLRLMAEKDSFASFGFSIADNPPLLASVSDWRVIDPTKLRHADAGAIARDLVASNGAPLAIDRGRAFVPMPREMGTAGLLGPPAGSDRDAEDIPSQILLLIR